MVAALFIVAAVLALTRRRSALIVYLAIAVWSVVDALIIGFTDSTFPRGNLVFEVVALGLPALVIAALLWSEWQRTALGEPQGDPR